MYFICWCQIQYQFCVSKWYLLFISYDKNLDKENVLCTWSRKTINFLYKFSYVVVGVDTFKFMCIFCSANKYLDFLCFLISILRPEIRYPSVSLNIFYNLFDWTVSSKQNLSPLHWSPKSLTPPHYLNHEIKPWLLWLPISYHLSRCSLRHPKGENMSKRE